MKSKDIISGFVGPLTSSGTLSKSLILFKSHFTCHSRNVVNKNYKRERKKESEPRKGRQNK